MLSRLDGSSLVRTPNPARCLDDGTCPESHLPFCDIDGSFGGEPDTCIAVTCVPNRFETCRGNTAITCNEAGDNYVLTECEHGCSAANQGCNLCTPNVGRCDGDVLSECDADGRLINPQTCAYACVDAPSAYCTYLEPRYLPNACNERAAAAALTITSSGEFSADLDIACNGGVVTQTGAPAICVVRYGTITIEQGVTLKVTGSRALAFVADDLLDVAGVLDVSADNITSGPGGGVIRSGASPTKDVGGGGAGNKTVGAAGASKTTDGGAGNTGAVGMDPALFSALVGGSRPMSAADPDPAGGGGGGAVTLVACRGRVAVTGTIDAGGGGGRGGFVFGGLVAVSGGGGGAGGYVVLQGLDVEVTGSVFANGGGGGSGLNGTVQGSNGGDGSRSTAFGGNAGVAQGTAGAGGAGGARDALPAVGKRPTATTDGGPGGGGGSMGFLQTYTPNGVSPNLSSATASPSFQPNGTVPTR